MSERKRPPRPGEGRPRLGRDLSVTITVNVPPDLKQAVTDQAARRGETVSEAVRRTLTKYAEGNPP